MTSSISRRNLVRGSKTGKNLRSMKLANFDSFDHEINRYNSIVIGVEYKIARK